MICAEPEADTLIHADAVMPYILYIFTMSFLCCTIACATLLLYCNHILGQVVGHVPSHVQIQVQSNIE